MRPFKKQETIVQNIAYMGIMAAINVVFVIMTYFIPFLLFVLVFVLPLCSAIISYYCKKIYFPIYFVVVVAICLVIDLSDTIFYVIPSLITGFFFGLCIEKRIPSIFTISIVSIFQFGISLASIPLIELITNRNIVDDMVSMFKLTDYVYINYVKYTFIFFISFVQTMLTYLVMRSELVKLGMNFNIIVEKTIVLDVVNIASIGVSILMAFLVPEISYIFLLFALILTFYRILSFDFKNNRICIIELGIIVLITIFFVAILYNSIIKPLGLLLFGIFPVLISIAYIINICLLSKRNKDTINK